MQPWCILNFFFALQMLFFFCISDTVTTKQIFYCPWWSLIVILIKTLGLNCYGMLAFTMGNPRCLTLYVMKSQPYVHVKGGIKMFTMKTWGWVRVVTMDWPSFMVTKKNNNIHTLFSNHRFRIKHLSAVRYENYFYGTICSMCKISGILVWDSVES